jgi:hypothetical protein
MPEAETTLDPRHIMLLRATDPRRVAFEAAFAEKQETERKAEVERAAACKALPPRSSTDCRVTLAQAIVARGETAQQLAKSCLGNGTCRGLRLRWAAGVLSAGIKLNHEPSFFESVQRTLVRAYAFAQTGLRNRANERRERSGERPFRASPRFGQAAELPDFQRENSTSTRRLCAVLWCPL